MSRIGKRELVIPAGVEVNVNDNVVEVKGKLGSLTFTFKPGITVKVNDGKVIVERENDTKILKQLHGTTNSCIKNMIDGVNEGYKKELEINGVGYKFAVSEGYKKELEINGVGYKFAVSANTLTISAGYSHPVVMKAPEGIKMECPSQNELTISGFNKQVVGEFAAQVRDVRGPEPYKGKGIKYKEEHIRRKEGKKAA